MPPGDTSLPARPPLPRVLVVEDEAAVRQSLVFHLGASGHAVEAFDAAEPLLASLGGAPSAGEGCIVADVRLPGMDGVALIRELARRGIGLPVVVVTGYADVPLAVRAMRIGAFDFLEKPVAPKLLAETVGRALAGAQGRRVLRREAMVAAARIVSLSGREREVFEGLVAGRLGKEVAADLGVSPRTVEIYRANAMEKLGVRTTAELIRLGLLAALHEGMGGHGIPAMPGTD